MAVQLDVFGASSELPRYLTRFTGREEELCALRTLIAQDAERLVTLIGPGGVGKTRLMVESLGPVAAQSAGPPVIFVDGAALAEPCELMPALAKQLDLEQLGDETVGGQLSEFLADRSVLVVLDNMEHLLTASVEVAALLRACPKLRIFVTSRSPLRISSERLVLLDPLATTTPADGEMSPAATMFVDRARLARSIYRTDTLNPETVDAICARLDGLPLSIELAAARLRLLSPEALLALLTRQLAVLGGGAVDTAPRHHTLQAAIAWSYDLLSEPEQQLFRQLGMFPESFSLEMVETICFGGSPVDERAAMAVDRLTALFDLGLLQPAGAESDEQVRFRMLVSIREFARDMLGKSGELEPALDRLTEAIRAMVNWHADQLTGPRQAASMAALAAESATIRVVLERAIERNDSETSLSLIAGLWRYWTNRGLFQEARNLIDRALAGQTIEATPLWGAALRGGAVIAELQSDWPAAKTWGDASLDIWEALDDRSRMSSAWIDRGNVHSTAGELSEARAAYERAEALAVDANDDRLAFIATGSIANVALRQGRMNDAVARYDSIVATCRQAGDQWTLATLLSNFGIALVRIGDRSRATTQLQESLLLYRELGDEAGIVSALTNLDEALGDAVIGSDLAREGLEIALRLNAPYLIAPANVQLGVGAMRDRQFRAAGEYFSAALRNFRLADNPIFTCEVIELIAELVEPHDSATAARLLGGTAAFREAGNIGWHGYHAPSAKQLDRRLERSLGEARYAELRALGAVLDVHALVIDALTAVSTTDAATGDRIPGIVAAVSLSTRELAVLRLMVLGKSDREIGEELFISPKTVNRHVANIFAKLDCHNRTAATTKAHQMGLV